MRKAISLETCSEYCLIIEVKDRSPEECIVNSKSIDCTVLSWSSNVFQSNLFRKHNYDFLNLFYKTIHCSNNYKALSLSALCKEKTDH